MNLPYSPNELIVFAKRNKPVLGSVCSVNNDLLTVLSEDGKQIDIYSDQIELKTSIIIDSDRKLILRGYRKELNESIKEIDLEFLWKQVAGSAERMSFNDLIEIYYDGKAFNRDEILKIYWAINKDTVYFKKLDGQYFPSSESEVNSRLWEMEKEEKRNQETSAALYYFKSFINEDVCFSGKSMFDMDYFTNLIKHYVVAESSKEKYKEAKLFVHQLGINTIEDATEFLIRIGVWKSDASPDLKKLEEYGKFSKRSLNEAESKILSPLEKDDFTDLTSREVFTIDDENTEDIDDAISIELKNDVVELGIHICNVAHYIKKGSSLDIEARTKGQTIYIPDRQISIFPQDLIKEKFSLFKANLKPTMSLLLQLDKKTYEIKDYRFLKSVISVSENLSYEQAAKEFLNEKKGKELANIAFALRRKRISKGAFILHLPELKISVGEDGRAATYKNYMNSIPHIIIAELMILTNNLAAKFIKSYNIPSIFRIQDEEVPQEGRELDTNDPLYSTKVVKYLRPSITHTSPDPHKSLGLDSYVQITSPIRRYFDLVAQRQIIGILEGDEWTYDDKELSDIISTVTNGFSKRRLLQKERKKYWLYKYLQDNIEQNIKGIVSFVNETNLSVYLTDFFVEIPIRNNSVKNLKEYDEVILKVEQVDPLRKRLKLKVINVN